MSGSWLLLRMAADVYEQASGLQNQAHLRPPLLPMAIIKREVQRPRRRPWWQRLLMRLFR